MIYPQNLVNYFYFISEEGGIVFDILTANNKDGCGVHLVKYETKPQVLEEGDKYLDDTNTKQTVETAGTYQVSTGKINKEANSTIFPCIIVESTPEGETENIKSYFFFQQLIHDGDKYSSNTFIKAHNTDDTATYMDDVMKSVAEEITNMVKKGYTLDKIKSTLPWWVFAAEGTETYINGKKNTVVSNSFDNSMLTDENIMNAIVNIIDQQVVAYANEKLKPQGKKLSVDTLISIGTNVVDAETRVSNPGPSDGGTQQQREG